MSTAIGPIQGLLVHDDGAVQVAAISWASAVDEPPTVRVEDGTSLYLSEWAKRGWTWSDIAPAAQY